MRQARCTTVMGIRGDGWGLNLGPGTVVDLDAEVAPGVTLAAAVAGREDCFETLGAPAHEAPPQADVETDEQPQE